MRPETEGPNIFNVKVEYGDLLSFSDMILSESRQNYSHLKYCLAAFVADAIRRRVDQSAQHHRISGKKLVFEFSRERSRFLPRFIGRAKGDLKILVVAMRILRNTLRKNLVCCQTKTSRLRKLVYWREFYIQPDVDDYPFIKRLEEDGCELFTPDERALTAWELIARIVKNTITFRQCVNLVSADLCTFLLCNPRSELLKEKFRDEVKASLLSERVIRRAMSAVAIDYPTEVRLASTGSDLIVVARHFGDLAVVLPTATSKKWERTRRQTTRIIFGHSALPGTLPRTVIHKYAHAVIPKNQMVQDIVTGWYGHEQTSVEKPVGDTRVHSLKVHRDERYKTTISNQGVVTIAPSGLSIWGGLENLSLEKLSSLLTLINAIHIESHIYIKPKNGKPSARDLAALNAEKADILSQFLPFYRTQSIKEAVKESALAIVIPSLPDSRISGVLADFAQAGVATCVLNFGQDLGDLRSCDNFLPAFEGMTVSSYDLMNSLEQGGLSLVTSERLECVEEFERMYAVKGDPSRNLSETINAFFPTSFNK